jgi:hypothetical protein
MALDRVAGGERDVVAALHHARAAALAEQALDRDRDRELRRGLVRVQRGEQPRAAGAEDQDVGRELEHYFVTPRLASACARRSCAVRRMRV